MDVTGPSCPPRTLLETRDRYLDSKVPLISLRRPFQSTSLLYIRRIASKRQTVLLSFLLSLIARYVLCSKVSSKHEDNWVVLPSESFKLVVMQRRKVSSPTSVSCSWHELCRNWMWGRLHVVWLVWRPLGVAVALSPNRVEGVLHVCLGCLS